MNKLMIFGDSIFKGVTYNSQKSKYTICNAAYTERLESIGIKTYNYSKMGATVDKIAQIIERRLPEIDKDTVVLLEFGGNDSDFNWQEVSQSPYSEHSPNTDNRNFSTLYKKIISNVKSTAASIIISNLTPIDPKKYMKWISNGRDYDSIMAFLGDESTLYRYQEYYNHTVEGIANDTGCPLLNIRHSFLTSRNYKALICDDGLHPTQAGHDIIGSSIYSYVSECV